MRHFLKIADSIDVVPLLSALAAKPDLWDENDLRTTYPNSPHQSVSDIWVMFNQLGEDVPNDIQAHPYRAWHELPIKDLILGLMRRVNGVQLGRVIITRLPPGKTIAPHVDQGAPADFYSRYHIALQSGPGCVVRSGGETVQFSPGEAWWFDNRAEHSVTNNSAADRIVIIVDIRIC
ncbi:aspartyl/asparaginyl beta-hydroxylase domain-containing protein [Sphingomonas sp. MA1305]|uniref:aspartyl/asparaginyl beta-hydroxylase domain-containing protein n=1 Tax=Sphingomonas sp. MA1305 TaxID=2479204 RepID=UPI0018DF52F1|nr:aspartyl/asparaginyl beta-hydroxylase domain-containing protein [Sphingomonas sp. MA1305]